MVLESTKIISERLGKERRAATEVRDGDREGGSLNVTTWIRFIMSGVVMLPCWMNGTSRAHRETVCSSDGVSDARICIPRRANARRRRIRPRAS